MNRRRRRRGHPTARRLGAPPLGVALTAVLAVLAVFPVGADAAASPGRWSALQLVHVPSPVSTGDQAQVSAMSCPSPGNCSAGGFYTDSSLATQAFVVDEVHGVWVAGEEVRGTPSLNTGGWAMVNAVSCSSAGYCGAGGVYQHGSIDEPFVVNETNGVWGSAVQVAGSFASGGGEVNAMSCPSRNTCVAVGDASGNATVATESRGRWGHMQILAGSAALNAGGVASLASVSCPKAGGCSAVGSYADSGGGFQVLVASEKGGAWTNAVEAPGSQAANADGDATFFSVSCASPGNCAGGGNYRDASGVWRPFVIDQSHGSWGSVQEVPSTATSGLGSGAVMSVSCPAAGDCAAAGQSAAGSAFVDSQSAGTWAKPVALDADPGSVVRTVSCAAPGTCSAGGFLVITKTGVLQAFVVSETGGTWGNIQVVPSSVKLNPGGSAAVNAISCPAAASCSAGGYVSPKGGTVAFVDNRTPH